MNPWDFLSLPPAEADAWLASTGLPVKRAAAIRGSLRNIIPRVEGELELERWCRELAYAVNPVKVLGSIERVLADWAGPEPLNWPTIEAHLPLWRASNFLSNWLARHPEWVHDRGRPDWDTPRTRGQYLERLREDTREISDPAELARALRLFKYREYVRLTLLDLDQLHPLEEVTRQIADLADAALEVALEFHWRQRAQKLGLDPGLRCPMAIVGMGKLGGRELNYSSDIDIFFAYTDSALPENLRAQAMQLFSEIAKGVISAMNDPTGDGIVFRVDTRLRPGGNQAPLAQPVEAAVDFYLNWGRTWERGALIKARHCAGNADASAQMSHDLQPFIYRRHLDFATLEDIREMKEKIDAQARAQRDHAQGWDVKLGSGGIREIEFMVQNLQLINAGRMADIRWPSTLECLPALVENGLMDPGVAAHLAGAYRFLRNLEHRLQMIDERQTQWLPDTGEEREIALRAMPGMGPGHDAAAEIGEHLALHRAQVSACFDGIYRSAPVPEAAEEAGDSVLWEDKSVEHLTTEDLARMGFQHAGESLEAIGRMTRRQDYKHLPSRALRDMAELVPLVVRSCSASPDPDNSIRQFDRFIGSLGGNTHYFALLKQNTRLIGFLAELFSGTTFLASFFLRHPELLDSLVMGGYHEARRRPDRMRELLGRMMDDARDYEDAILLLRKFHNEETLRIGLADLSGELDLMEVQQSLTDLADVCVERALALAYQEIAARYHPGELNGHPLAGLAILALGKMGGQEMNYSSDLDLIFVIDEASACQQSADPSAPEARPVSVSEFYAKLIQKFITTLSVETREGRVYEIDVRLRPSGTQGPLVTTLERMIIYQQRHAQTWERQALLRARPVGGSLELGRRLIAEVLPPFIYAEPGQALVIAAELREMRDRIQRELAGDGPDRYNLKYSAGGLVDIEFIVQHLQLVRGGKDPTLRLANTARALEALTRQGWLDSGTGQLLLERYQFYRRLENRLRMLDDRSSNLIPLDRPDRLGPLARALDYSSGPGENPAGRLAGEIRLAAKQVREAFLQIVNPAG